LDRRCMQRVTHHALNHRTVAEIQRKVVNQGGRDAASRLFHAKNDKEMIATWRADLTAVLHVFNVRSVGSVCRSLTILPFRPSWKSIPAQWSRIWIGTPRQIRKTLAINIT